MPELVANGCLEGFEVPRPGSYSRRDGDGRWGLKLCRRDDGDEAVGVEEEEGVYECLVLPDEVEWWGSSEFSAGC